MTIRAIRGAITLNENTAIELKNRTVELIEAIIDRNFLCREDIAFVIFTVTKDIDADFPAKFARENCGFSDIPMMCYNEMDVKGALPLCLRALFVVNSERPKNEIRHVYLKRAQDLRKDLK